MKQGQWCNLVTIEAKDTQTVQERGLKEVLARVLLSVCGSLMVRKRKSVVEESDQHM